MKRSAIYKITGTALALLCLSLFALGLQRSAFFHSSPKPAPKKKATALPRISYDPKLVAAYEQLFKKYDTIKQNCTMAGSFNVVDLADTSDNMKNVDFLFSKSAGAFYYKLGTTETINADGLYIFIDNKARTMIVTTQKRVEYDQQPAELVNIDEAMRTEGYEIKSDTDKALTTISLMNEHNINCKQFSISFDTTDMHITRMYARMTNLEYPARKDKEKIIDIDISQWSNISDPDKYFNKNNIVRQEHHKWKPVGKYSDYELTEL